MNRLFFVVTAAIVIGSAACGPMNSEKKTNSSGDVPVTAVGGVNTSKNSSFLVYSALQASSDTATAASPQVGDNVYLIRCVRTTDLSAIAEHASVKVTYGMPDMPAMGQSEATATRQADGTYRVTLFFSMSGRWQMTVKFQDGGSQDEYVFETNL